MTRKEKELKLENLVLRNFLDCIIERLDIYESSIDDNRTNAFIGGIMADVANFNTELPNAMYRGYTFDYRSSVSGWVRLFIDGSKEVVATK